MKERLITFKSTEVPLYAETLHAEYCGHLVLEMSHLPSERALFAGSFWEEDRDKGEIESKHNHKRKINTFHNSASCRLYEEENSYAIHNSRTPSFRSSWSLSFQLGGGGVGGEEPVPGKYFLWIKSLILVIYFNTFFPSGAKKATWQDCWHVMFMFLGERRSIWPTEFHTILILLLLNRFYNLWLGIKWTWGYIWT